MATESRCLPTSKIETYIWAKCEKLYQDIPDQYQLRIDTSSVQIPWKYER